MNAKYDPTDLVVLTAGIVQAAADGGEPISVSLEHVPALESICEVLHRLWLEIPAGEYPGVFAYDITETLAYELAGLWNSGQTPHEMREFAEGRARVLIAEEMQRA